MNRDTSKHAGHAPRRHPLRIPFLLILLALLLLADARWIPGAAEVYATQLYPLWQGSLGRLCGKCPYSVSEIGCLLLPALLLADGIVNRYRLQTVLRHWFVLASILFLLYAANCGVNYYREPFVAPEVYVKTRVSEELLTDFCERTVHELQRIDNSASSVASLETLYPDRDALAEAARKSMSALGESEPSLKGFYPKPKELTVLSRFFSGMGVSGIYSPFTIEANINGEMPDCIKPFTACHELSHLRGFMNEGEANYIGWLACIQSKDPAFNRSGWIAAWNYAGGTLRRVDPAGYETLRAKLPEAIRSEIDENSRFWRDRKTRAAEVQDRLNDAYLKTNGQSAGIASYGQVTTLMLYWYEEQYQ